MRGKPRRWRWLLLPLASRPAEAGHYRSVAAVSAQQSPSADDRAALVRGIDAKREKYAGVAKEIWGFAEVGYQETRRAARCCSSS